MMGGEVLADVIFGDLNPSGKLPITFPKALKDSPAHKSQRTFPGIGTVAKENLVTDSFKKVDPDRFADNKVFYDEGIYVGYRHFDKFGIDPLFPFGFGLSYTTFDYQNCTLDKTTIGAKDIMKVSVTIKNSGAREGAEVIQMYYSDVEASVDRPIKELCGFAKVSLKPGESKTVDILLHATDLAFYDINTHAWKVEPGKFKVLVGSSSRDIKFDREFTLK
jgi:beta-glucosidase